MAAPSFTEGNLLRVGGHDFHCEDPPRTTPPGQFPVHKNPDLVENYIATIEELRPSRIVELGINRGGSTALISELARPEKLVAIELDEIPVAILTEYVEREGLTSTVRPHYGVDQSDRSRLAEIMRAEFGSTPIDLVFDDASHLYEQSRSSFETIFPLLRPDGVYVIEDWRCQHRYADSVPADANHLSERQQQAIIRRMEALDADRLAPVVPLAPCAGAGAGTGLVDRRRRRGDRRLRLDGGPPGPRPPRRRDVSRRRPLRRPLLPVGGRNPAMTARWCGRARSGQWVDDAGGEPGAAAQQRRGRHASRQASSPRCTRPRAGSGT